MTDQSHHNNPDGAVSGAGIAKVRTSLTRLAARARTILLAQRLLLGVAALLAALMFVGMVDFLFRFPIGLRLFQLAAGLAILSYAFWKFVLPAWRFRPSATAVALRLEKRHPEWEGYLASGLEFASGGDASRETADSPEMARYLSTRVVDEAARRWKPGDLGRVYRLEALQRAGLLAALAIVVIAAIGWLSPNLAMISAARTLTPWSGAEWPKRTMVVDATDVEVHPLGAAAPLRAALVRSHRTADRTDVAVRYQLIRDGRVAQSRRALLTWQEREIDVAGGGSGALFERLVDADADVLEYRFETIDDQTPWRRIKLTPAPEVKTARVRISPPEYASALRDAQAEDAEAGFGPLERDMGPGRDERAVAPRSLAGSRVELDIELNKPTPLSPDDSSWVVATLGPDAATAGVDIEALDGEEGAASRWRLRWTLDDSVRLTVSLVDEYGIVSVDDSVYRFEAVQDQPPTVTVTAPDSDRSVLATAVVDVEAEARDDVALDSVWIERQRSRPAGAAGRDPSGPGGAMEPIEDPVEIARVDGASQTLARARTQLDLSTLGVRPGDEVLIQALATDIYATETVLRDPSKSMVRRLRIISEADLIEEIRSELNAVRQSAIRLDEQQQQIRDNIRRDGADAQARRGQAQVSERIARQRDSVDRLSQRAETNALDDDRLESLLDEARRLLDEAGRRSEEAARMIDEAAREQEHRAGEPGADGADGEAGAADGDSDGVDESEERSEVEQAADRAQRDVQRELESLIELLDRGEDAWVMRRQLENILEEQRELREQTAQAGAETAGRSVGELNEQERSALEDIVQRQQELAERQRELAEELRDRAAELREDDPAAAAGLAEAARRAEENQTDQTMQQAAGEAQENRMSQAGQSQEQAIEDLEEMLEGLDRAEQAREEALRRVLASIIESIEALIRRQETELETLQAAEDRGAFDGVDVGMIRLNQNTLGVQDTARATDRALAPVANMLGRAADEQSDAIVALRADPVGVEAARNRENASLERLREAKALAEELERELARQQMDRERRELRRLYQEMLERQTDVREETGPYAEADRLTRRDQAALRALGERQVQIRKSLSEAQERTQELLEARVFDFAHRRLDRLTGAAGEALRAGEPSPALPAQRESIALLQGLVDALQESAQRESEFDDGGGGGEGEPGEGEPQLIPPLAELRLLRQIQADVLLRTREMAESRDRVGAEEVDELGSMQRELHEIGQELIRSMMQ